MANMIGTGAFTSLGFQLKDMQNPLSILTLWALGGVLALSGAFSYAEVGTYIRKSGGEYAFLSEIYHPLLGYLSGWNPQLIWLGYKRSAKSLPETGSRLSYWFC